MLAETAAKAVATLRGVFYVHPSTFFFRRPVPVRVRR